MENNSVNFKKNRDKHAPCEVGSSSPSEGSMFFQIFFLTNDPTQDVEVLETKEMDFWEIVQRLKMGDSVFINYKNSENYKPTFTPITN